MAKSQDAKKTVKKEPLKTAKEKKEEKREKKNSPKRDQFTDSRSNIAGGRKKKQFKDD